MLVCKAVDQFVKLATLSIMSEVKRDQNSRLTIGTRRRFVIRAAFFFFHRRRNIVDDFMPKRCYDTNRCIDFTPPRSSRQRNRSWA
ncbi:hypothetical protein EVAR_66149_1 [Eumeta japonica]|uniref:Uncharacterized protein n=1 Tax=Eumeta variegata TaxID=151549 RepID=A0A4C1YWW8_EUMVA|nr:hypothetical protein EVAR_66149_1 [Eumeta japonica]